MKTFLSGRTAHTFEQIVENVLKSDFENIYTKVDPKTGLHAVIAVHSTKRGSAIGGCRNLPYPNTAMAIHDAMALAQMMTYKAAISDLPHGGAKAVLIQPKVIKDRRAYMHAFGEFVHQLKGRYITAIDSNTNTEDMAFIAEVTPYVLCTNQQRDNKPNAGNPAPSTALGVKRAIEAAIAHCLPEKKLSNLHVAIQGVGAVGFLLAKLLCEAGAKVTVTDRDQEKVQRCSDELTVQTTTPDKILSTPCDILSPCALGHVLTPQTIPGIQAKIIVGAANNQLGSPEASTLLQARSICYIPDFLANAGGLIFAAGLFHHLNDAAILEKTNTIYDRVLNILEVAVKRGVTPLHSCYQIVQQGLEATQCVPIK